MHLILIAKLILAALCGDKQTLELILNANPNINKQNEEGKTALMWGKKNHLNYLPFK